MRPRPINPMEGFGESVMMRFLELSDRLAIKCVSRFKWTRGMDAKKLSSLKRALVKGAQASSLFLHRQGACAPIPFEELGSERMIKTDAR